MTGSRIFVALAFLILGASFLASTGLLINEFRGLDWQTMVVAHSHLFFFFPVFGLLALAAFYLPSVVFTHLYWHHVRFGRLRFLLGLAVVAALSFGVSQWLDATPRAVWEVSPRALTADRADPPGCGENGRPACRRAGILDALGSLRSAAQSRIGLSKFARNCAPDPLLEIPEDMAKPRYCFPAKGMLPAADCCAAQMRFERTVYRLQSDPAQRSLSGALDQIFIALKIFFVLIVVAIGLLLAVWRDQIDRHYRELVPAIERGVIIGAFAMLFWPAMDYAYQQTANALFGRSGDGPQFRLSLVIAPWALLLLFYFLRRLGRNLEKVGQISGVIGGAVAVLRYEELNDWSVRLLGIGAQRWMIAALFAIALAGFVALLWPWSIAASPADRKI